MSKLKEVKDYIKKPSQDTEQKPGFDWLIWVVCLLAMIFVMALAIKKL